jgi:hypothetical protein
MNTDFQITRKTGAIRTTLHSPVRGVAWGVFGSAAGPTHDAGAHARVMDRVDIIAIIGHRPKRLTTSHLSQGAHAAGHNPAPYRLSAALAWCAWRARTGVFPVRVPGTGSDEGK